MQNRVKEIRSLISPKFWSHCSGRENPADLPSRGVSPMELVAKKLWKWGPDWLRNSMPCADAAVPTEIPNPCLAEL